MLVQLFPEGKALLFAWRSYMVSRCYELWYKSCCKDVIISSLTEDLFNICFSLKSQDEVALSCYLNEQELCRNQFHKEAISNRNKMGFIGFGFSSILCFGKPFLRSKVIACKSKSLKHFSSNFHFKIISVRSSRKFIIRYLYLLFRIYAHIISTRYVVTFRFQYLSSF